VAMLLLLLLLLLLSMIYRGEVGGEVNVDAGEEEDLLLLKSEDEIGPVVLCRRCGVCAKVVAVGPGDSDCGWLCWR